MTKLEPLSPARRGVGEQARETSTTHVLGPAAALSTDVDAPVVRASCGVASPTSAAPYVGREL
jgi:hypothetical protein